MSNKRKCEASYEAPWGGVVRTHWCDLPAGHWPRTPHHCAVCGNNWDVAEWSGGIEPVAEPGGAQ